MKVAIPTRQGQVDDHFGHCEYYTIFTINNGTIENQEMLPSPAGCGCKSNIAPKLAQMGVSVMLAGNMGEGALSLLSYHGISVYRGCSGDVKELIGKYLKDTITDSGKGCTSHEGCDNH
ncbi:MAG TPA: NifB/NifX family molybdenum-iron cluster-binding protein [Bacteroidales bacterium]|nr:NifB/NifX family molybdenum-iron cluster-binding protein [Bacteroidales bacterium]HQI70957.1 NifB/NifX family molybdenum-iron cluster-binding protein [Bacteroidales bacterium]